MKTYPKVLTIAGSDSGGGAGIQADLKTMSALGVYGMSAITAVTAQNTVGVRGIQPIAPEIVAMQIEAVMDDLSCDAVKIGMLHSRAIIETVADKLKQYAPRFIVVDPVMISTSGHKLLEDDAIACIVDELFPIATVVTPNIDEAEYLSGMKIENETDMQQAAERLLKMGCRAVLMKGGHLETDCMTDLLFIAGETPYRLTSPRIESVNNHGTGCTLSSAIASYLALGNDLPHAVAAAKQYISEGLAHGAGIKIGHGHGALNHFFAPQPLHIIERER